MEGAKLGYHAALGVLLVGALAYNALAFARRRERHLLGNVLVYAILVAFETHVVLHHHQRKEPL